MSEPDESTVTKQGAKTKTKQGLITALFEAVVFKYNMFPPACRLQFVLVWDLR